MSGGGAPPGQPTPGGLSYPRHHHIRKAAKNAARQYG